MPKEVRVAVLVSGGGTNLQAILDAEKADQLSGVKVVLVLSSKSGVEALERARKAKVPVVVVDRKAFATEEAAQVALLERLLQARVEVVCLAGYMRKISSAVVRQFKGRILNIHPALLPKYGGAGMYGHFVHEAVLASGDKESGCSVHVVDDEYDHGPVLAQVHVPVLPKDTPEKLAARILQEEHKLYPKVIKEFCEKLS